MEVRVTPESQEKNRIAKVLTAALYEAGVKIDQITLLLQKYVDVDYHTARNYNCYGASYGWAMPPS